jgi:hypothetical protein
MNKTLDLNSSRWVELAVLAPGQSHYWFFDPSWEAYGWVFQATAYPESAGDSAQPGPEAGRVEVTELYIVHQEEVGEGRSRSRVNITVTNCGDRWAPYSLWVASIPPAKMHVRRPSPGRTRAWSIHQTRSSMVRGKTHENARRP